MALIVPNTEAEAGKHQSNASKVMNAINRFDIFIPRGTPSGSHFLSSPNSKPDPPLSKKSQRSLQHSRNNGRAFEASFESEKIRK
jgi:hypothetical protein